MDFILRLREQDAVEEFLSNPSEGSFCELFANVGPRIMRYFRTQGCDRELAEDLTQDVMLIVYRRAETVRDKTLFRPWLYKVAKNSLLQYVRRNGRQVETVQLDLVIQDQAKLERDPLSHSQFVEWMAALEPDEREIMTLRYVEELEYHEIASVLEMPLGTVQWKIFHSKRKLAARFAARPV